MSPRVACDVVAFVSKEARGVSGAGEATRPFEHLGIGKIVFCFGGLKHLAEVVIGGVDRRAVVNGFLQIPGHLSFFLRFLRRFVEFEHAAG